MTESRIKGALLVLLLLVLLVLGYWLISGRSSPSTSHPDPCHSSCRSGTCSDYADLICDATAMLGCDCTGCCIGPPAPPPPPAPSPPPAPGCAPGVCGDQLCLEVNLHGLLQFTCHCASPVNVWALGRPADCTTGCALPDRSPAPDACGGHTTSSRELLNTATNQPECLCECSSGWGGIACGDYLLFLLFLSLTSDCSRLTSYFLLFASYYLLLTSYFLRLVS